LENKQGKERQWNVRSFVSSFLLNNWKIKLGSLVASFILFGYVQYSKNITRVINIRVERPEIPPSLVLNSKIPSFMNVSFTGSNDIIDFNVSAFRIVLSHPKPEIGENLYTATLLPELPENIEASFHNEIPVVLDRLLVREVRVQPTLQFKTKEKGTPGYIRIEPPVLKIEGPYTVVSEIESLTTHPVEVHNGVARFSERVKIAVLPDFVTVSKDQPVEFDVTVHYPDARREGMKNLMVENVPVQCHDELRGLSMKILGNETVNVQISVPVSDAPVTKNQLTALVACSAFYDEVSKTIKPSFLLKDVPVQIESHREEIEVLSVTPPALNLQFEKMTTVVPGATRKGYKEHIIK